MMNSYTFTHVPPGFRFHPTDEELVDYYLRKKVDSRKIDLDIIKDIDLYKIEPWDLRELCKIGTEEQSEWYFFSHKDKKYPTGTRTNRATKAGFWKATGRDKTIYTKHCLVGMRKTLVFYKGRAPNGQKSDWIMHEYRLETNENGTPQQEQGWVVCRVFKKRTTTVRRTGDDLHCWYDDDQISFMTEMVNPREIFQPVFMQHQHSTSYPWKKEFDLSSQQYSIPQDPNLVLLPHLENPKVPRIMSCSSMTPCQGNDDIDASKVHGYNQKGMGSAHEQDRSDNIQAAEQVTDWRVLDKLVASQLSQDGAPKETNYSDGVSAGDLVHIANALINGSDKEEMGMMDFPCMSGSSCIDLWK